MTPYIVKTVNDDVVPVLESIRPLNISLPKVYPFASDKTLIFTLEEQMRIQEANIKETEKTGDRLSKEGVNSATRPMVIFLSVALSIVLIVVIILVLCLVYRCRWSSQATQSPIVNIETTTNQPAVTIPQSTNQNSGSLYDLLKALEINKK
jgi:hypothetical protein